MARSRTGVPAQLLEYTKTLISRFAEVEDLADASSSLDDALESLRSNVYALSRSCPSDELPESDREFIFSISYKLWNKCVAWSYSLDTGSNGKEAAFIANLRQIASELMAAISSAQMSQEEAWAAVLFHFHTGKSWLAVEEPEKAEMSLEKAMQLLSIAEDLLDAEDGVCGVNHEEVYERVFDLYAIRMQALWRLDQMALVSTMLSGAQELISDARLPRPMFEEFSVKLAELLYSKACTLVDDDGGSGQLPDAEMMLNQAYELLKSVQVTEGPPADGAMQQKHALLMLKVLLELAHSHMRRSQWQSCRSCTSAARALLRETAIQSPDEERSLCIVAFSAALEGGNSEQSELELLELLARDDLDAPTALSTLHQFASRHGSVSTLRQAARLLRERLPGSAAQLTQLLLESLLNQSPVPADVERWLLEMLDDDELRACLMEEGNAHYSQDCYVKGWNQGVSHFEQHEYESALAMFHAVLPYSPGSKERGSTAQSLAMCCLALQKLDRALEYVEMGEAEQPDAVWVPFFRLKVALLSNDQDTANTQLERMASCADFVPNHLQVACQEAVNNGAQATAREALLHLHKTVLADRAAAPLPESTVLRCILRSLLDEGAAAAAAAGGGRGAQASRRGGGCSQSEGGTTDEGAASKPPEPWIEAGRYFSMAASNFKQAGYAGFFGQDVDAPPHELEWFAHTSWSCALDASAARDCTATAVLLAASAHFLTEHPAPQLKHLQQRKLALLLAATSAVELHERQPDHAASLKLAGRMVNSCKEAAALLQAHPEYALMRGRDKSDVFLLIQEFKVATRQANVQQQMAVLERCKSRADFTAQHLCALANYCKEDGPFKNLEVTAAALRQAVEHQLGQAAPDYDSVAKMLRFLIQLAPTDPSKLALFKEARQVLVGVKALRDFPPLELHWLVSTCWNRGSYHAKFGRLEESEAFMAAALELVDYCPGLHSRQAEMTAELQRVRRARKERIATTDGLLALERD